MKYATPYKYATLCGVSTQAIYERIRKGTLDTVEKEDIDGKIRQVIDLKKNPPAKWKESGRKNESKKER